MTDLPQRLRAASPEGMLSGHVNDLPALREAADEIERLRGALEIISQGIPGPTIFATEVLRGTKIEGFQE